MGESPGELGRNGECFLHNKSCLRLSSVKRQGHPLSCPPLLTKGQQNCFSFLSREKTSVRFWMLIQNCSQDFHKAFKKHFILFLLPLKASSMLLLFLLGKCKKGLAYRRHSHIPCLWNDINHVSPLCKAPKV